MQDLRSTYPSQETYATDNTDNTGPTRQRELLIDHTRSGIDQSALLKDLDHEVGIDYLFDTWEYSRQAHRLSTTRGRWDVNMVVVLTTVQ